MNNKKQIQFIINPVSGVKAKDAIPGIIRRFLNKEKYDYDIVQTDYARHAIALSKAAVDNKCFAVIAVGGDGTVNEIAQSLIGSKTVLGIIPVGSGNGLARELKISLKPEMAVKLINKENIKAIDTGVINDRPFFCAAGLGFEAVVAYRFSELNKRGFSSYLKEAVKAYRKYDPEGYKITYLKKNVEVKALQITISNTRQYGNNAFISPLSKIDDGLIELNILQKFKLPKAPLLAARLFLKNIHKSSSINTLSAGTFDVIQEGKLAHIDGEPVEIGNKLRIAVKPLSLNVICNL